MATHFYLKEIQNIDGDLIRLGTLEILNYYHHPAINSKKKWINKGTFRRNWTSAQGQAMKSLPIGYDIISKELLQNGFFSPHGFNLFPMECIWLDHSLAAAKVFNQANPFIELGTDHVYGTSNPVSIRLDQPGIAATSMMNHLFRHVIGSRARLIQNSDKILELTWYLELRNVICDAVSLVDMTLNRLHYQAENNPNPTWIVAADIGTRHGGRLLDKLQFIHKCTGQHIGSIGVEKDALSRLKDFRNQFMHFDPPYFKHEFAELTGYLNDIMVIGMLMWKIRKAIGAEISSELIAFMLQKRVEFVMNPQGAVVISL